MGYSLNVPSKKGKPLFLSRSALNGHEFGLNGPQDIDGSFIDISLGVPRTSFPGLGPLVTGGSRRFPSEGLRQVLVQTSILSYEVIPISTDFSKCRPSGGGGGWGGGWSGLSPFFFSLRPDDPPLLLPWSPVYLPWSPVYIGIFLWSSPDPGIVPVLGMLQ